MKKILLSACIGLSLQAFSLPPAYNSDLGIESHTGSITVKIDDQYFAEPTDHFYLENIHPGNHKIEIFRMVKVYSYGHTQLKKQRIFSGRVSIETASIISAVIDPYKGFYIEHIEPAYAYAGEHYYDPYQEYGQYPQIKEMDRNSFSVLNNLLQQQWFDDTKLDIALQALQSNYFTSGQINELLRSFTFEDTRLRFAKTAYGKVVDPNNYFMVNNAFTFSSSIEELSNYIRSYH